jgi:hypothetical protein
MIEESMEHWWGDNLIGKGKEKYSEKPFPSAILSTPNPTRMLWDLNEASAVRNCRLTPWAMILPLSTTPHILLLITFL